jgi:hypothetical protein
MAWWSRRHHATPPTEPDGFSDGDLADLDGAFAAAEAEEARHRDARLAVLVAPLVARSVPARVIEPAPGLHAARIRFADGTSLLVRGRTPGDVGVLARWVRERRVVPVGCSTNDGRTELAFRVGGRSSPFVLLLTGLDQPD